MVKNKLEIIKEKAIKALSKDMKTQYENSLKGDWSGYTISEGLVTKEIEHGVRLTNMKCSHCNEWLEEQSFPVDQRESVWRCPKCNLVNTTKITNKYNKRELRVFG